ncbi:hypothetical protein GCM10009850_008450 [Nonomuraea monospora]|uniref:Uncharacterized protein n=1 Tax=Nonomuraea monospora TaxID=568818 RepID=A0ABN3C7Q7_9ACTN
MATGDHLSAFAGGDRPSAVVGCDRPSAVATSGRPSTAATSGRLSTVATTDRLSTAATGDRPVAEPAGGRVSVVGLGGQAGAGAGRGLAERVLKAVGQRGPACLEERVGVRVLQHEGDDRPGRVLVVGAQPPHREQHRDGVRGRQPEHERPGHLPQGRPGGLVEPVLGGGERLQQHPGPLPGEHPRHQREQRVPLGVAQPGVAVELRVVPNRLAATPGQLQRNIVSLEMREKSWRVHEI